MDLAEEELKLKCDIAGLAREGVTEKAAAVLITKKESLLTDIKNVLSKQETQNLRLPLQRKIAGTKEELYRAEMAFSNAQTKVESGKAY